MDNLQYLIEGGLHCEFRNSFKPYYKWIIFNIIRDAIKYKIQIKF